MDAATVKLRSSAWAAGNCKSTNVTKGFGSVVAGRRITTLAGFSLGRLGPIYYLQASSTGGSNIDRIVCSTLETHRI